MLYLECRAVRRRMSASAQEECGLVRLPLIIVLLVLGVFILLLAWRHGAHRGPVWIRPVRSCGACRHENEPAARFCARCGQALERLDS